MFDLLNFFLSAIVLYFSLANKDYVLASVFAGGEVEECIKGTYKLIL